MEETIKRDVKIELVNAMLSWLPCVYFSCWECSWVFFGAALPLLNRGGQQSCCKYNLLTMMFHRSHKGMKRWKFRTWIARLSLASTFACWVKNNRNPFNTGLRELVLGAPRYGARRTQGNTPHATTTPVTSAVPSTLLINKTLPWIVDWILVQTFHAC